MKRTCLVLGSALVLSGCSALFVSKPPLGDGPLPKGSCTTSALAPALDVSMAALQAIGSLKVALDDSDRYISDEGRDLRPYVAGSGLLTAGALSFSASRGFKWTRECKARQEMSEAALVDHLRALSREVARDAGGRSPATASR